MTDQVPDSCTFEGRKWVIDRWAGDYDIVPTNEQLGINTVSPHTANWRGRIDHFMVHHGKLCLFKVEANLTEESRDSLPQQLRREVLFRYEPLLKYDSSGESRIVREYRFDFLIYDNLLIPFTGNMHLTHPYFDPWEIPYFSDDTDGDEINTDEIVLTFEKGILFWPEST